MGKLTKKDLEMLEKSEVFDKETSDKIRENGLATGRKSVKHYMKTKDNVWVIPTLYWRNAKGTVKSKKMEEFNTEFSGLLTKYATERK